MERFEFLDTPSRAAVAKRYGLLPSQTEHRVNLLFNHSGIFSGDRVLEIGCGQGDCTAVLALQYPESSITAIDPAPLDYGDPETLGQAHERINGYDIGEMIGFHQASPIEFLEEREMGDFDVAVLCHCLWYFGGEEEVKRTFEAMKGKVDKLFIAEWGLSASSTAAQAHVLAALTRATCEAHIPDSNQNIRSLLSPVAIKRLAKEAGWELQGEAVVCPGKELDDAGWEIGMLTMTDKATGENLFLKRAREKVSEEKIVTVLESMLESMKSAIETAGGMDQVRCMDVWCSTFFPS